MATIELTATTRDERGSHNNSLRRQGRVPGVLYGHKVEPLAISAEQKVLDRVWMRAGRTHLIDLKLDGGKSQKVLVREIQTDPRTGRTLHADFFAVNLREKLTADVPIVITGESPAVVDAKIGTLQQLLTSLRVECLPADLPSQFSVDVSELVEIDQGIYIRDIVLAEGVTLIHADLEELVVKVSALRVVEEEAVAAEVPEGEEGAAPSADASEEAPAAQ